MVRTTLALAFLILSTLTTIHAQAGSALPDAPAPDAATLRTIPKDILHDQAAIWTSPIRLNDSNALEPFLLVAGATVLITADHQVMSEHFLDPATNSHANTASTGLTGLFIAAPVAVYGLGRLHKDSDEQETGILAGEAMVDSLAVNEAVKIVSRRERPTMDGAKGKFFQPGVNFDSSFASNHCVLAWSSAAVIASQHTAMAQIAVYGLATGVSLTRVIGRDHFPSDVFVGSAVGWMIGRYVLHRHRHVDSIHIN